MNPGVNRFSISFDGLPCQTQSQGPLCHRLDSRWAFEECLIAPVSVGNASKVARASHGADAATAPLPAAAAAAATTATAAINPQFPSQSIRGACSPARKAVVAAKLAMKPSELLVS